MGLRSLPQLLIQTVNGLVAARPRVLKVDQSSMSLTDNLDGTVTLSAAGGSLEVKELDGSPDVSGVTLIEVSNGTLTDNGGGSVSITTGGGGGGPATSQTLTAYNGTGVTLTKGTAVWNGGDADAASADIKVTVADKTAGGSANPILGLVSADIANGATGTVITFGSLTGLDTHTFAVGDFVMVNTVSPVIGLNLVPYISYDPSIYRHLVAIVTKSDATTGSIFIDPIEFSAEKHIHTDEGEGGKFGAPIFTEQSAPATPSAGDQAVYIDSTLHHLTRKTSGGTVVDLETLAGSGTVTSVQATVPTGFSVSGGPVTTTGTLAVTLDSQTGNKVLSSPSDGSSGTPDFRALVAADIPAIAESGVTNLTTDLAAKAPIASPTFTGITTAPEFSASGLTGATAASRYVGATASGAPVSGTFAVGDWISDQTGKRWTCTVAGTPGTWVQEPGTGGVSSFAPWLVDIIPSSEPSATTGTWVLKATGDVNGPMGQGEITNDSPGTQAQNDALSWDVVLSAGTWTAEIHCRKSSNTGIFTLNQDGSSMGTADSYNASAVLGKLTISGWTVSTDGKHTIQLKMATKNGSSSGYLGELFALNLRRTA